MEPTIKQYEIFFCSLVGEFKKVRGLFTLEERFTVMEALRKANYKQTFFTALYSYPQGEFAQEWTYAEFTEERPVSVTKNSEAPEVAPSEASDIQSVA